MIHLLNTIYGRLGIAILLSALALSFGDAFIFDRLVVALLVLATIVSFPLNKDTFSILVLACLFFGFEELNWLIIQEGILFEIPRNSPLVKLYCYGLCLLGCYLERDEKITKAVFAVTITSIGFEAFWLYNKLDGKQIDWFILMCALALIAKYILFYRPHILHRKYPDIPDWTFSKLDQDFEMFIKVSLMIQLAMIFEYLLRYITGNNSLVYVYYSFPYLGQVITLYLLISAIWEIKRNFSEKHYTV